MARYAQLYFDEIAAALRGQGRPFAISPRSGLWEERTSSALVAQYQTVFRLVRAFFGTATTEERKRLLTARAHILNEALFWSEVWLPRFAIGDFPTVRQRLLAILGGGLVTPGTSWRAVDPFIASHFLMSSIDAAYDLKGREGGSRWNRRSTPT